MEVKDILIQRGNNYGSFDKQAEISQLIKYALFESHGRDIELSSDQREALEMIAHKMARIVNGNPNLHDHWIDISGYATLVANRLEQQ